MKYGLGETLSDYGFAFLEKLHYPIFLVHRNGTVKKINEAGRKLLKVAHLRPEQISEYARAFAQLGQCPAQMEFQRIPTLKKQIKVFSKHIDSSDYVLVEVYR